MTKSPKRIKAWAVFVKNDLFMSSYKEENRHWARIMRTKKQAKKAYPVDEIIPVLITPLNPKRRMK